MHWSQGSEQIGLTAVCQESLLENLAVQRITDSYSLSWEKGGSVIWAGCGVGFCFTFL